MWGAVEADLGSLTAHTGSFPAGASLPHGQQQGWSQGVIWFVPAGSAELGEIPQPTLSFPQLWSSEFFP